jgi:hypothetical protein
VKNQKSKLQQIWESDSLTRVLWGSWNLLELTWQIRWIDGWHGRWHVDVAGSADVSNHVARTAAVGADVDDLTWWWRGLVNYFTSFCFLLFYLLRFVAGGIRVTAEGEDHCSPLKMVVATGRFYWSVGR